MFFLSGEKSFELLDIGENVNSWFLLIERGRRFTSRLKIDEIFLRWVCEQLQHASLGSGDLCRSWGRKIQAYIYIQGAPEFQRLWSIADNKMASIIIPEIGYNTGWRDSAGRILQFLSKTQIILRRTMPELSYTDAAMIQEWPESGLNAAKVVDKMVRVNPELVHKKWQVTTGLRVSHLSHNQFLFHLLSKQEATRVKEGEWF